MHYTISIYCRNRDLLNIQAQDGRSQEIVFNLSPTCWSRGAGRSQRKDQRDYTEFLWRRIEQPHWSPFITSSISRTCTLYLCNLHSFESDGFQKMVHKCCCLLIFPLKGKCGHADKTRRRWMKRGQCFSACTGQNIKVSLLEYILSSSSLLHLC